MPVFYHYTCRNNIEGIFRSGLIFPGNVAVNPKEIKSDHAVCLTSDQNPNGHGLPDGREISLEQASKFKGFSKSGDNLFSIDFTKFRIKINIPDNDENLIYLPTLLAAWPDFLKVMEMVAYYPCSQLKSPESILAGMHLLQTGVLQGKAHTWWYYRGEIPLDWFVEVGVKVNTNLYLPETPDKFQELVAELSRKQ